MLAEEQKITFEKSNELDFSFGVKNLSRFRANVYMQRGAIAGKAGYLRENGLERLHRDALGIVIAAPINGQVLGSIGESLRHIQHGDIDMAICGRISAA